MAADDQPIRTHRNGPWGDSHQEDLPPGASQPARSGAAGRTGSNYQDIGGNCQTGSFLLRSGMARGLLRSYHERLFEWHCHRFYPLDRKLSALERRYLQTCFELCADYTEAARTGSTHFSYYTFSHRVRGANVNSSRFAYGSITHPDDACRPAVAVCDERGIDLLARLEGADFYGLGWDFAAGHFKVYGFLSDLKSLPAHLAALVANQRVELCGEGLVSWTYRGNELAEEKVYVYPELLETDGSRTRVARSALMITTGRGLVRQDDVSNPDNWLERLNPAGREIVAAYRELGEDLDTIAYRDPDNFTLYFP